MAQGRAVLQDQGRAVGVPTACVLWASLGDPRQYSSGPAYRKAMGLNLVERSSGEYQGELRISKRGQPRVRRWLYLAVLRLIPRELVATSDGERNPKLDAEVLAEIGPTVSANYPLSP